MENIKLTNEQIRVIINGLRCMIEQLDIEEDKIVNDYTLAKLGLSVLNEKCKIEDKINCKKREIRSIINLLKGE